MDVESGNDASLAMTSSGGTTQRKNQFETMARVAGLFVLVLGAVVLSGWTWSIAGIKSLVPALSAMDPVTAMLFTAAGVALLLHARPSSDAIAPSPDPVRARLLHYAGWLLVVAGLLRMTAYVPVAGWPSEGLPFRAWLTQGGSVPPSVGKNLLLLGLGFLLADRTTRHGRRPNEYFLVAILLIAFLALLGRAYQLSDASAGMVFMPVPTAAAFFALALGALCARPDRGMMRFVTSEGPGGTMARMLLPGMALVMGVLGWLQLAGERRGAYSTEVGMALYTFAFLGVFGGLIWWSARLLYRSNAERLRVEAERERFLAEILVLNGELATSSAQLKQSNSELEAFSYTVSHDLRAPLRHIDGYSRMLREDAGDQLGPEMHRYLEVISDSAVHMGALIDDLLSLSRLGRQPLERTWIDMDQLVGRALQEARGDRHPLATVVLGDLPQACADPVLLRQAWVNLLSNALKYSTPRGAAASVEVSGERDGDVVRYRVRDNGVGFDMRYADKLFGVFQRLHSNEEFEGTGVGLAIVQRVLARHGGHVVADAQLGQGATFTMELPVTETPA